MRLDEYLPANILTLHPDPLVRAGIVASLRQHGGFDVFEEDPDRVNWDGSRFDVVIVDQRQAMRLTGAARRGTAESLANARILVLASDDREADVRRALGAGIHGYLLLGGPLSEFIEAVTALARGLRYLGRSVAQRMVYSLTSASLTSREVDVLQLVVSGESNKAIARRLSIEVGTVKTHMNGILGKLNATSRTQAAAIAVTQGIVEERMPIPTGAFSSRVPRVESAAQPA
ncbi:response regulator transcription factor [Variovorax guangxiensis]|uniref:response regulator transcription factor n=1 Tax=Variovorax guangxiensis TaxID=1775474 RepID=UPI0028577FFA|nr:response regulator transcription factor [Variovorax guangxiensis]MDR6858525.1 DNA-binding NarL/FixJ family response regulator [Variovorax guangxiensis]